MERAYSPPLPRVSRLPPRTPFVPSCDDASSYVPTSIRPLLLALVLSACAHAPPPAAKPVRDLTAIDPNAEPAEPLDPTDAPPLMNAEYYLGSRAEEEAMFDRFMRAINERQSKLAREHAAPIKRGFHAKGHACLTGNLELDPNRDPRTRFGVFANGESTKKVIVRFSNGVGVAQPDTELDARGMAIKVFGATGSSYQPDEPGVQDFLMTNAPVPVGRDAVEFMKFAEADTAGRVPSLFFLLGHASTAAGALSRTTPVSSMVTERYWSGGSIHLGAHQAAKYSTRPCDLRLTREPPRSDPDYLRKDLLEAAREGVCMTLYVQLQADPVKTPIEDASKEWEETDAPLLPVARVVMPAQTPPADTSACDALEFTPWHAIPAHKPMGHINRARRFVYAASAALRHAKAASPP